jgi:hypothetical protein
MLEGQSEMVVSCICNADAADDPDAANEYDAAAEVFAELGCERGQPPDLALLASVCSKRSIRLAPSDPARSADYRQKAESLFDAVEESGDTYALGIVAFLLNELAENNPTDDAAIVRLGRIVRTLTTDDARLFRDAVNSSQKKNSKRSESK